MADVDPFKEHMSKKQKARRAKKMATDPRYYNKVRFANLSTVYQSIALDLLADYISDVGERRAEQHP